MTADASFTPNSSRSRSSRLPNTVSGDVGSGKKEREGIFLEGQMRCHNPFSSSATNPKQSAEHEAAPLTAVQIYHIGDALQFIVYHRRRWFLNFRLVIVIGEVKGDGLCCSFFALATEKKEIGKCVHRGFFCELTVRSS
jgi:hypothetical protein